MPGGIKETCGHGTKGHGLVLGLSRSSWWWNLMILKAFSSLLDSVIHFSNLQILPKALTALGLSF